ncbi:MAG TPA: M67 family metallopeptidase [Gemmatimonadota bacterium]|nr:M67 family metallopeptidase [Gemmatimonadota bacterium]
MRPASDRRLVIGDDHLAAIRSHAEEGYPDEVCGFLLGRVEVFTRIFVTSDLRQAPNLRADAARNRYLIDPEEYRAAERDAAERGLDLIGVYHSHPDAAASPSVYDRDHAWPFTAYVIVSVERGAVRELSAWVLADDRSEFVPLAMEAAASDRTVRSIGGMTGGT